MRKTIIVGTGAVAAELTSYILDNNKAVDDESKKEILGYIEFEENIEKYWKKYQLEKPVLGDIDNYDFTDEVEVIIGIADIDFRNKMINRVLEKKVKIGQFIHHSVIVPSNTELGIGNIIYPYCIIGPNCKIGDYNLITSYSFISHDTIIGDRNFLSTAGLAGRVCMGHNNFLGIRSTVLPGITIGDRNTIQAGMIVDKSVGDYATIFYKFKEKISIIKQ